MKTILLTFENEPQRDQFLHTLRTMAATMISTSDPESQAGGTLVTHALENLKFDPPIKSDTERQVALFVAGKKMAEGNLAELNKKFNIEVSQHSGSVQIRELRGDEWTVIRQRPIRSQ